MSELIGRLRDHSASIAVSAARGVARTGYVYGRHRVMVQVQSSWFPVIDRNPQTFVSSIFEAKPFRAATHHVHRSARYPSHVILPVLTSASFPVDER